MHQWQSQALSAVLSSDASRTFDWEEQSLPYCMPLITRPVLGHNSDHQVAAQQPQRRCPNSERAYVRTAIEFNTQILLEC